MGVLSDLTEEYFGNKVRKEDVTFRYSIDENFPPEHVLTPDEESFLQGLAKYKLFLDKSLFFQIEDLQRHTELVLSGRRIERDGFPSDPDEMGKEMSELYALIKELEEKLEQSLLTEMDLSLLDFLKEQLEVLNDAIDNPVCYDNQGEYLGRYFDNGGDSIVILYLDAIEDCAKRISCEPKLLMGQVLLHEYFHSFYFHTGAGTLNPIRCAEEPMAEFGSLIVLDSVSSSGASIAQDAGKALTYTLDFVRTKQACKGRSAAYGFGAYLFDNHKKDFQTLIADYANVSRLLIRLEKTATEYKYLLYPTYPRSRQIEYAAYNKLKLFLNSGKIAVREDKPSVFAKEVFKFLDEKGLLDRLAPYISVNPFHRAAITLKGYFNLNSVFWDNSFPLQERTIIRWFEDIFFVIHGQTFLLSRAWSVNPKNSMALQIDQLIKMMNYVYPGQFDIHQTGKDYILIEL